MKMDPTVSIDELYTGISVLGDDRHRPQADALMAELRQIPEDLSAIHELVRTQLLSIMATIDWDNQFANDAHPGRGERVCEY